MKYQLLLLLMLLSFVKASAQVEDKADYEPDFNDEPVLLSDVYKKAMHNLPTK